MAVDVHAREAVDQGPAGNLHPFEVRGAELALRKGIRQHAPGHADQLGIVARQLGRTVMIEIPAARDDLEMGGVAQSPSADRPGQKLRNRASGSAPGASATAANRSRPRETPLRLLGHRRHQGDAARKMPERRPRRNAGAARGLAHTLNRFDNRPPRPAEVRRRSVRASDRHDDRALAAATGAGRNLRFGLADTGMAFTRS